MPDPATHDRRVALPPLNSRRTVHSNHVRSISSIHAHASHARTLGHVQMVSTPPDSSLLASTCLRIASHAPHHTCHASHIPSVTHPTHTNAMQKNIQCSTHPTYLGPCPNGICAPCFMPSGVSIRSGMNASGCCSTKRGSFNATCVSGRYRMVPSGTLQQQQQQRQQKWRK
jgi:hypothetical protein